MVFSSTVFLLLFLPLFFNFASDFAHIDSCQLEALKDSIDLGSIFSSYHNVCEAVTGILVL